MNGTGTLGSLARLALSFVVVAAVAVGGWYAFVEYPTTLVQLLGVLLVVLVVLASARLARSIAESMVPSYNVAEVAVEGPITRDSGGSTPLGRPGGATADDVVERIEQADESRGADALLVKLNTPGGEIVPSADITNAVADFDGPTIGYATDVCASGGYEIASACDELWCREGSIVGSIGVIGSRVNAADLADRLGLDYQQFTAGEFKDAGTPLRDIRPDERAYLQGIVDDYYDQFVAEVVDRRELSEETVRDTEARVFLGREATDIGLADELGTREDVIDRIEATLDETAVVREFTPQHSLAARLRGGARSVAFAVGAGIATAFDGDVDGLSFRR